MTRSWGPEFKGYYHNANTTLNGINFSQNWPRARQPVVTIIVVGIGSILFHGTLLFSLQLFDEVPMMFCVLMLCYSVFENQKEKKFGKWFPIGLTIWGLFITAVMVLSGRYHQDRMMQLIEFYVFQGSFVVMAGCVYLNTLFIVFDSKAEKGVRRLWLLGSVVFLIGYIGWHIDLHFCSRMHNLPFDVPNPQLHAWWHFTASYGSYLLCVLVTYNGSKALGKNPSLRWILSILPYIELPENNSLNEKSVLYGNEKSEKVSNYGTIINDVGQNGECEKHVNIIHTSTVSEYSERLETYSKKHNIKNFEYSQYSDLKCIGKGGYGVVYSATFQGQQYALKSLNNNLNFGKKEFKNFKRELECLYKIDHSNIIKFYGISRGKNFTNEFNQCLFSNEVLVELDKLSAEIIVEFIIYKINNKKQEIKYKLQEIEDSDREIEDSIRVNQLKDWLQLNEEKDQLINEIEVPKKNLELMKEKLKNAKNDNKETKELEEQIKNLQKELDELKEKFYSKLDKMGTIFRKKEIIINTLELYLKAVEKWIPDGTNKSTKEDVVNLQQELKKLGLAAELNELSNKQREVNQLKDWLQLNEAKDQLVNEIEELKKKLELKEEELKNAKNDSKETKELKEQIKNLQKELDAKKEKIEELENNEKEIRKLSELKTGLKELKEKFHAKLDKMITISSQKKKIINTLELYLEAVEKRTHDGMDKSIKDEVVNKQQELKKLGLAAELNDLSNKQREVTKMEIKIAEIKANKAKFK
ncbi:6744_t:CDS:10 [Scutellospora calospora]|uniref:6744_t:CDS:1 n=1 Tax=Scutellospora calospora TaxID=85575 RepID=A0ACA9JTL1_9GLOM|nr:6744_t:CDS:10 [Scutellospora calospora]